MLVAQHTLNGRTLVVRVATPKASSVPSLKEFLLYMYYPLVDTSCIMFQIFGFSLFPLSCDIIFYRGKKWDSNFMLGPCEYLVELQIIVNYVAWSLWPSVKTYTTWIKCCLMSSLSICWCYIYEKLSSFFQIW